MDAKLGNTQKTDNQFPTWDYVVVDGIVPMIFDAEEQQQQAVVASYLQLNTIPQLKTIGVDWVGFLTKKINFGELNSQIRNSLDNAGREDYQASYSLINNQMNLKITKG